ncbi:MAG TPA: thiamine phosphate synthase [Spirochaetota bacterium]|nr:thiamine phosphate synthase [Spirochaetota bacterium]
MKGYYFVSDTVLSAAGMLNDVRSAVNAGAKLIQYREKNVDTAVMYKKACEIKAICRDGNSKVIINDRVDIALAVDADGVHIGQSDMPYEIARRLLGNNKIIGVTVHNVTEAIEAERLGADYLGVSPIFSTHTKTDAGNPCGLDTLKKIRQECAIPIAAIGGIDSENVDEVIEAGADMVCMISAVIQSSNVTNEILQIQRRFRL